MMKLLLAFLSLPWLLICSYAETIVIYHTSDVHGAYSARQAAWGSTVSARSIGGFPALSSLLKKEKNPYLVLDSGDMFMGTPEGYFSRGMASVALMNKLGYKAAVVGNHDFDYGEENLKKLVSSAAFAVLGADVYVKETGKHADYLKPYVMVEAGGRKIGVLGIASRNTYDYTMRENVERLRFSDEAEEAEKWVPEMRKAGAEVVVLLSHSGLNGGFNSRKVDLSGWEPDGEAQASGTLYIARRVKGIDVALGGHFHSGSRKGYHDKISGTFFAESYTELSCVSRVELEFDDKTGKFAGAKGRLVNLWTDETGEDPETAAVLKPFADLVRGEMDAVLGETLVDLTEPKKLDSPMGNWITDVMRKAAGADAAFHITDGTRAEIPRGKITLRHLYETMPFDNALVAMDLKGEDLVDLMRANLTPEMSHMQISGMKVVYSVQSPGAIADVKLYIGGKPVDPKAVYRVVTYSYLASGRPGGEVFTRGTNILDTRLHIRDLLVKEARTNSPLTLPEGGRIIRLDGTRKAKI